MWRTLIKSIREYKKPTILAPVFVALEVIIECTIPFITALLVNQIKAGCTYDVVLRYGLILIVLASMSLTLGWLSGRAAATAASGFARNLRKDLFYNIQSFSFENIDRFSSSSLVTRLTTDVTNVQNAFMMLIRIAVRSPLMLVFAIIMSFLMGGKLALIFVVVIPMLGIGLFFIIRAAFPIFRRVFRKYDALNRSIQENVQGIRVVKSFVREDYEKQKFGVAAEELRQEFTKAEKILAFNGPMMQFCLYINMVFILTFGAYTIATTGGLNFNVGQLSSLMIYSFQTLMSLMMLSMVFVMVTIADESSRRIVEVLSEDSSLQSPENAVQDVPDGSVDFDHVSFRYSEKAERMALLDVDLHIRSGETIGILGTTGSSKTSLVQLIPRLYDATSGTVRVGGRDVKEYDLTALRNQVSVVLQNNLLFSGTIAENLRWGNPQATDEELKQACEFAQADDFICSFPQGYETRIEQGGTNVSGGQKQRLSIARALLKKPRILILDDSTSAVDTHTDAKIRAALKSYLPETTKIIIAQRVASVMDADRIVMLDKGGISSVGTHEELLKTDAAYREVYESQSKAGEQE
ncbi:MAG: ABC transporter [Firmicutes bacterium HGW-Firmicutes-9]|jgi:ATP-binding cassette subfamily B protein|nr:MAG: ABC transporter [Firmicutes bacterium HGW-Firmicutes-9]